MRWLPGTTRQSARADLVAGLTGAHTVIVGFMAAAAVVIIDAQLGTFFGIAIPRGAGLFDTWGSLIMRADEIDLQVTLVSVLTLGSAIAMRRYRPRWPYMIIAMLVGALAARVFDQCPPAPPMPDTGGVR